MVLVTGANGQLGRELQKLCINQSESEFIFTDIDTLNITEPLALEIFFADNKIDYIINCAAYTAVDKAETDKETANLINSTAVKNLAIEAAKYNSKLIHISTDYVFDGNACQPYIEDSMVNPQSIYGQTKLNGEKEALNYPNTIVIRTSWLYSSYGNNFVKTMLRLSNEKNEIRVIFDQIGTPTYAEDLAEIILKIIIFTEKDGLKTGIYHISNEGVCSWYDLAWEIIKFTNKNCKVIPIESKEYTSLVKRPFYSVLNKDKVKKSFNIEIPHWRESLNKCLTLLTN